MDCQSFMWPEKTVMVPPLGASFIVPKQIHAGWHGGILHQGVLPDFSPLGWEPQLLMSQPAEVL